MSCGVRGKGKERESVEVSLPALAQLRLLKGSLRVLRREKKSSASSQIALKQPNAVAFPHASTFVLLPLPPASPAFLLTDSTSFLISSPSSIFTSFFGLATGAPTGARGS